MINGFLLTRQAIDTPRGLQLEFWFSCHSGPVKVLLNQQHAIFFIRQNNIPALQALLQQQTQLAAQTDIRPLELVDFQQQPMAAVYCASMHSFYRLRDCLKDAGIKAYESDIRPADRFLSERFITATACIDINGNTRSAINPRLKPCDYSPQFRLMSLDIETAYDTDELYSIGLICGDTRKVLMQGPPSTTHNELDIEFLATEKAVLERFIELTHQLDPDIIIGWNVVNFDLRFLQKKADSLNIRLKLGRSQSLIKWRQAISEDSHYFILIPGRVVLDGIDTLKSATWNFPSFALDNVAHTLLGKGKLIQSDPHHDPLYKAKEIKRQFKHDKISLAQYNLQDCQLVLDIFQHTNLIHFAVERARLTGLEMDRIGGSVAAFDNLYLPRLHRRGYIAPNIGDAPEGYSAPGGYVMNSQPGLYDSVIVLDYKSLYPSIIRTFRVDPYAAVVATLADEQDNIPGYNGISFSRENHILPDIIRDLWQARDRAKQEKNAALSQAIKIIMNSFYGVLGTPGCRVHDARLTSSITLRGHDIIKQTVSLIEEQGYSVIYGDTDSVFVSLGSAMTQQQADSIGQSLAEHINYYWKHSLQDNYKIDSALEMEYETHYLRFFMPTIRGSDKGSKKRYAGLIRKHSKTELVFKGLESVRTDWTELAREFQKTLYLMIFNNEPYNEYILTVIKELNQGKHNDKLVYRKRLRQSLGDYQRNIPPHARAAIRAEEYFKEHDLPSRYQHKGWIEYVMTLNGPETLECQTSKLDYDHYIEKQLSPIADSILVILDDSMHNILNRQYSLF